MDHLRFGGCPTDQQAFIPNCDIDKVGEAAGGKWFDKPDLSKVDEIGWTDMTPGLGHAQSGWADVDWRSLTQAGETSLAVN